MYSKISFKPIADKEITILILGTIPGDKSLELNEYYGHPRNRFWKIIATITNNTPSNLYFDKKQMLLKSKIGLWDVAHKANRKGSLDSAIRNEKPNDIEKFLLMHRNIKTVCFNGRKAEALYDKYFKRKREIKYILLPSTSPANARFDFDKLCAEWKRIL
jgi:hypoxanthine-DNA glycosylase